MIMRKALGTLIIVAGTIVTIQSPLLAETWQFMTASLIQGSNQKDCLLFRNFGDQPIMVTTMLFDFRTGKMIGDEMIMEIPAGEGDKVSSFEFITNGVFRPRNDGLFRRARAMYWNIMVGVSDPGTGLVDNNTNDLPFEIIRLMVHRRSHDTHVFEIVKPAFTPPPFP